MLPATGHGEMIAEEEEIPATGEHVYTTETERVEVTCTGDGTMAYFLIMTTAKAGAVILLTRKKYI